MTAPIEWVDMFAIRLPLVHEFQTSSHRKGYLEHILVRAVDGDGQAGWGECASPSDPYYGAETVESCWRMIHDYFAPLLIGRSFETAPEAAASWRRVRGNEFARAALDIACWDLVARRDGVSLAAALGGSASEVPAGVSLGIEPTIDDLLAQVAHHAAAGYQRVKLKIAPGWDVEPVRAVTDAFPALTVQVDANGAYVDTEAHHAVMAALDAFGLAMIEQPFAPDDLLAHAALQARSNTPICLDESVTSVGVARTALRLGAMRVLNVKVSRLGGLGPAREAHDVCRDAGVPVWCGGMHEFGVGRAANVALASLPGFTLTSDVSGSDKYFERDVVTPAIRARDGLVPVPYERLGIGHDVDIDFVEAMASRRDSVSAPRS
jgi:O-succinylbenzoate synthase